MKKYLLKRILFSIFSLVVVIGIVTILVYKFVDRSKIIDKDPNINKYAENDLEMYINRLYAKYGYIDFIEYYRDPDYTSLDDATKKDIKKLFNTDKLTLSDICAKSVHVNAYVKKMQNSGYSVKHLPVKYDRRGIVKGANGMLYSSKELSVFIRLGKFFSNLFRFETINDVKDDTLTDRYIRLEWDKRSNMPALVGSGTTHRYLIYFDNKFPFVHQNIFHINLGLSYTVSAGSDIVQYMKSGTGRAEYVDQVLPKDIDNPDAKKVNLPWNFHEVTYLKNDGTSSTAKYFAADDNYTNLEVMYNTGVSRIGLSFILGICATFIAYLLGLPLGIWMAQRKDKLVDKIGNLYIIFIMAVPSLAYIFMLSSLGSRLFGLPLDTKTTDNAIVYILPVISLLLPQLGGLMKWMRRFMVDQQNSDYVKFARSQGLSEGEIFSKHISRNAFTFLVHNIPIDILGCLVGAIITERVYNISGVGQMLTKAIDKLDNPVIVGVTAFYTTITIVALLVGDLLLAKYDPRISLTGERG